jgi:hypothetical protein
MQRWQPHQRVALPHPQGRHHLHQAVLQRYWREGERGKREERSLKFSRIFFLNLFFFAIAGCAPYVSGTGTSPACHQGTCDDGSNWPITYFAGEDNIFHLLPLSNLFFLRQGFIFLIPLTFFSLRCLQWFGEEERHPLPD